MNHLEWRGDALVLLDQTQLPGAEVRRELRDAEGVAEAIASMRVRGAPAVGVAAAYGLALAALGSSATTRADLHHDLRQAAALLRTTRPTAANLAWALDRTLAAAAGAPDAETMRRQTVAAATALHQEDIATNRRLGSVGRELLPDGATVLTHCNTGDLATAGYGTAMGIIRAAWEAGVRLHVLVTETRPRLQGARLTTWELARLGIPATLIVDAAAGGFLRRGEVTCVLVGADRIAANGDVANKVGTYPLAVLARENRVPFYVAAPLSTVDLATPTGEGIPIEERPPEEVTHVGETAIAPPGTRARNPAFDVTPARYITAIVTEAGVIQPPYRRGLMAALCQPVAAGGRR